MKRRLLCTYDGEGTALSKTIKRLIRNQSIKNSFLHSRSQTEIRLQFQFIPFDPEHFKSTSLSSVPYLHVYFVTCNDVDVYKRNIKGRLAEWFKTIEENNVTNFLFIIVNGEKKLQIRSSVADKIKSDFLAKYNNRLVVLYDPYRDTPKSRESWATLCDRIIELAMTTVEIAFNYLLNAVRVERESRNRPEWDFSKFFLLQEEVAILYESLALYGDALVQYDELDAMLTQYLENAKVGQRPNWLNTLLKSQVTRWDAFQLDPGYTLDQVERIKTKSASLLDLRNYLFARKARLLSQLQRHEDLAKAALVYVSGTFQELTCLDNINANIIRTWAVLAGFNAFQLVERADSLTPDGHTRITTNGAVLLDLARGHLFKLGDSLGLAEGTPNTEDIESIIAGFVSLAVESDQQRDPNGNADQTLATGSQEITSRLEMALSSPAKFEAFYLNICSKTIDEFRRVGRSRTAVLVGRDLAKFHCRRGNYERAEELLIELQELFETDKWNTLVRLVNEELIEVHKRTGNLVKLASVYFSMSSDDNDYLTKFYEAICDVESAHKLQYPLEQIGRPLWAHCTPSSRVDIKESLKIQFELQCLFDIGQVTAEVWLEEVAPEQHHDFSMVTPSVASNSMVDVFSVGRASTAISMGTSYATSTPMDLGRLSSGDSSDDGFFTHNNLIQFNDTLSTTGPDLRYFAQVDQRSKRTRMVGISSPALRMLRNKKSKALRSASIIDPGSYPNPSLRSNPKEINLLKGANKLEFDVDSSHAGRYSISRLCLFYDLEGTRAELVSSQLDPPVHIEVMDSAPVIAVNIENDRLYAGVASSLDFSILVGSRPLAHETLGIIVSRGLSVISTEVIVNIKSSKSTTKLSVDIEYWSNQLSITLPYANQRAEVTFSLEVKCPLHSDEPDINGLISESGSLTGDFDDDLSHDGTEIASDTKNHHINLELLSTGQQTTFNLHFLLPFNFISTTYNQLLSLCIQNRSTCRWHFQSTVAKILGNAQYSAQVLKSLTTTSQIELLPNQSLNFLWDFPRQESTAAAEFIWCFELESQGTTYKYEHFDMGTCHKPLYRVQYESGRLNHTTGLLPLTIKVRRCQPAEHVDPINWHIADDRAAWGISGRTSGVMYFGSDYCDFQSIQVDLMPLFIGNLRLPILTLRRLFPKSSTTSTSEHDSSVSSIETPLKGMKRVSLKEGEVEFVNPLAHVAIF